MLLMSGVSLIMVFLIPKMKDAINDPEIKQVSIRLKRHSNNLKEMEDRKKKGESPAAAVPELPDIAGNIANFFANSAVADSKKKKID